MTKDLAPRTMSEAVELLGCPFCGGEALKCKGQFNNMRWVLCRACHASPGDYPTEAEAVAAWNRRANHGEVEPVAWREAVDDVLSHERDWREALTTKRDIQALDEDRSYWQHQLDVLDRIVAGLSSPRPVAWPDREAVARALHARYEERARQRGQIGGDGYTVLGGARLEDCSRSLRQSFLEDADAVLSLLSGGGE